MQDPVPLFTGTFYQNVVATKMDGRRWHLLSELENPSLSNPGLDLEHDQ